MDKRNCKVKCVGYKNKDGHDYNENRRRFKIGEIYEVKNNTITGENDTVYFENFKTCINVIDYLSFWYDFEIVDDGANTKIVIATDGTITTATIYKGEKYEWISAEAKCSPNDKFNFMAGAKLAMERLEEKIENEKKIEDEKPYNGRIVCVKSMYPAFWTVGRIYEVVNGCVLRDEGSPAAGITKENVRHIGDSENTFIPIVE